MLKLFRHKNVTKIVLWGLLILILPAFVLWGTGNIGRSKDGGPTFAGYIDGKKVSFDKFADSLTKVRCQIFLNYFNQPKLLEMLSRNQAFMGKLSWDRLLMAEEAKRLKIKKLDTEVVAYIRSHPLFLRDGKFDEKMYGYLLRNNIGLDARSFEEIVRENLAIQKMTQGLTKGVSVTDEEVLSDYRGEKMRIKISYMTIPYDMFIEKAEVDDKEVREYYDKNRGGFIIPVKEGNKETSTRLATFEEAKNGITSFLAERQTRPFAVEYARAEYAKIRELMDKDKLSFEAAAKKEGQKTQETQFFSKTDYLEGLGEAQLVIETASVLKEAEVSAPVEMRKGVVIFRVVGSEQIDQTRFDAEKAEYAKQVLEKKRNKVLEKWLRQKETNSKVMIDLNNYEKYYR